MCAAVRARAETDQSMMAAWASRSTDAGRCGTWRWTPSASTLRCARAPRKLCGRGCRSTPTAPGCRSRRAMRSRTSLAERSLRFLAHVHEHHTCVRACIRACTHARAVTSAKGSRARERIRRGDKSVYATHTRARIHTHTHTAGRKIVDGNPGEVWLQGTGVTLPWSHRGEPMFRRGMRD